MPLPLSYFGARNLADTVQRWWIAAQKALGRPPQSRLVSVFAVPGSKDAPGKVVVTRRDERHEIEPGEVYTFGRSDTCSATLDPDDLGISRVAGSIEHEAGTWWVHNRSSVRPLTAIDDIGIRTVVAPGRRLAVVGEVTVVVDGALRRHAITITSETAPPAKIATGDQATVENGGDPLQTMSAQAVVINDMDRKALVALFAGYLEPFPRYHPFPRSYAEAAAALGWPRSTLVKRVEYIRTRLTSAGVPNLLGETALPHLAEWVLATGVLTRDDLGLLRRHRTEPR